CNMVRYVPRLANGERVKLPWPLLLFRLNHIFWPLDASTTPLWRRFDYLLTLLGFSMLLLHNDAELRYLRENAKNLDLMLAGVPTYLILVEGELRNAHVLLHRAQFRELLQQFYASIYVDRRQEAHIYQQIERKLRLNRIVSALYLATVSGYILAPISMLLKRRRDFLFSMIPAFDTQPLYIFLPLTVSSLWVAMHIVTMVFGETALLCELISHLEGRYKLLQRDLDMAIDRVLTARKDNRIAREVREILVESLRRSVALSRFGAQLEEHFTVRIFIMFAFSALLLCALAFKTYTSPSGTYMYPIWFGAKTVELLSLGQLGTSLAYLTDMQSSMYYLCRWEQVIYYSTNPHESLRLMKFIALAIEVNYKPFYLTGLSHFRVSIQAVLKILQGAFSYFTFLTSLR
ncbi:hypothetical protein KR222_011426, partial [Zaprionus bogoriensis]